MEKIDFRRPLRLALRNRDELGLVDEHAPTYTMDRGSELRIVGVGLVIGSESDPAQLPHGESGIALAELLDCL